MYVVRKLKVGTSSCLDELAKESGRLYSQVVVYFWRVVRKKGIWLSSATLMKLFHSDQLHSQSAQATIQAFEASLKSWRTRRKGNPHAKPPWRRRKYFKVIYKSSAIRLTEGILRLSNGKGNEALEIPWRYDLPRRVEIGWEGTQYELRAIYEVPIEQSSLGEGTAAIDLGEIHPFTMFDGEQGTIYNGRHLRSIRRYQNRLKGKLAQRLSRLKRASRQWRKLKASKAKQLKKVDHQILDISHKLSSHAVSTLYQRGVHTLVIGDVRDLRQDLDYGKQANQKIHQWLAGTARWQLSYKWEALGGEVKLQNEAYTSSTCPTCGARKKPKGRVFSCPCGFQSHRDLVGAVNIRKKYLGYGPVVGDMAPPTGVRFHPHLCSSGKVA
jgi:putative transposase